MDGLIDRGLLPNYSNPILERRFIAKRNRSKEILNIPRLPILISHPKRPRLAYIDPAVKQWAAEDRPDLVYQSHKIVQVWCPSHHFNYTAMGIANTPLCWMRSSSSLSFKCNGDVVWTGRVSGGCLHLRSFIPSMTIIVWPLVDISSSCGKTSSVQVLCAVSSINSHNYVEHSRKRSWWPLSR